MNPLFRNSKSYLYLFVIVVFFNIAENHFPLIAGEWQKKYDYDQIRQQFEQPPLWYAPHTFWFWDDTLDISQTSSMAKEMTEQRLNPGYAHPRHSGAPDKPYPSLPVDEWLSPFWFNCFSNALTESEKAGMTLGYCDEYWWPSGQAAGRVLEKHPELAAQSLKWTRQVFNKQGDVKLPASKFTVCAKLTDSDQINAKSLQVIGEGPAFQWKVPDGKWVVYSYSLYHHPGADNGKVNYLDPHLMDVFIPIAHEGYEKHFKEKLGKSIPGVFVDNEGDYGWQMAWSEYLDKRYREMKNRDIRLWMPLLTEQDEDGIWAKARYDWFDVVSDIYSNQFLGKLSNWLEQREMYYISNLWEEDLMLQTRAVGDFMRAQRAVTLPGNDCLEMKSQQVHDFKETQSVCEFENRPFMSELMGVAGWEQTPVQMKMTLNAVTAWGVTHSVPHGINLNRKLETIPYPADWYKENPYWRYLHLWTDFARRAAFVNRQGKLVADILLINPLESAWALSDGYFKSADGKQWPDKVIEINKVYSEAMDVLTHSWLDYLIADRYYMEKAVIKKPVQGNSSVILNINDHDFSVIVLPPMFILSRSTVQKILDFASDGGHVVLLGDLPQGSPEAGADDPVIVANMDKLKSLPSVINLANEPDKLKLLPDKIKQAITPQVEMQSGNLPLLISHRRIGENNFYWLVNNTDLQQTCSLLFRDGSGSSEIWDCETGEKRYISNKISNNRKSLDIEFKPYEALWIVFNVDGEPLSVMKSVSDLEQIKLANPWLISFPETDSIKMTSAKFLITNGLTDQTDLLQPDFDDSDWPWLNILGETRALDEWRADLFWNPQSESKRYYRYVFNLDDNIDKSIVNVNADNSACFWVNGVAVQPGIHSSSMTDADTHDIGHLLQKGANCIAVEATNHPGFGWMIFQGQVLLKNGTVVEILSDSTWKETDAEVTGWQAKQFKDSDWSAAMCIGMDIKETELKGMREPQKLVSARGSLWWRMGIPPGAKECKLPGLSKNALFWIDGKSASAINEIISIPDNAKILVVKNIMGENGLSKPAVFYCVGSSQGHPGSWLNMGLRRFTGFVDYENRFNITGNISTVQIDLGAVLHMAEVWVNDKKIGERLWPPFEFDATTAIRPGENDIRLRVGNLMVNEMGLKDDLGELRNWGWNGIPSDSCFDSGLLGPVKIFVND